MSAPIVAPNITPARPSGSVGTHERQPLASPSSVRSGCAAAASIGSMRCATLIAHTPSEGVLGGGAIEKGRWEKVMGYGVLQR